VIPDHEQSFAPATEFEEVRACAICGGGAIASTLERGIGLRVHECASCGLAYVSPRPTWEAMLLHYERDYAVQEFAGQWVDSISFDVQRDDVRRLKRLMETRGVSVLDVGCGPGLFLEALRRDGAASLVGIEPGRDAAAFAAGKLPDAMILTRTYEEAGAALGGQTFDLVVGFDLIEHLYDPREFLRWVRERLRPGGLLCLKTPNWDAVHRYGPAWEGLWRDFEHVYYFSRSTLGRLLEEEGFSVVKIAYEPYRADFGGTARIRTEGLKRKMITVARAAIRPIPVVNRVAYAALQRARGWKSREDERRGTAHGLVVAARRT
jgi:2-polyprenyl-6-hydroxyphenyl methylase/3-demethylubiquinone-9 3-methyltransferase